MTIRAVRHARAPVMSLSSLAMSDNLDDDTCNASSSDSDDSVQDVDFEFEIARLQDWEDKEIFPVAVIERERERMAALMQDIRQRQQERTKQASTRPPQRKSASVLASSPRGDRAMRETTSGRRTPRGSPRRTVPRKRRMAIGSTAQAGHKMLGPTTTAR